MIGSPTNIRWSYSDAKALEEAVATALNISHGLQVTTVRFFNTVGPKQTGMYGMVLPRFVQSALQNSPIEVHGVGEQSRVFCHVTDAVAAVVALLENQDSIGEVFNVGGAGEISIKDLAKLCIKITDSQSEIRFVPYSSVYPVGFEDMQRRVPNTEKIFQLTGWVPKFNIQAIVKDVVNYFQKSD